MDRVCVLVLKTPTPGPLINLFWETETMLTDVTKFGEVNLPRDPETPRLTTQVIDRPIDFGSCSGPRRTGTVVRNVTYRNQCLFPELIVFRTLRPGGPWVSVGDRR